MEFNFVIFLQFLNILIGIYSYRKKKLTLNGTIAAMIIGIISIKAGVELYLIVIVFFITSSFATKLGKELKEKLLSSYKKEKTRDVYQVLCNGGFPTLLAIVIIYLDNSNLKGNFIILKNFTFDVQKLKFDLGLMYLSYYAACNADTWASEIGFLSKESPVLITNFNKVPRGTNGGISTLGVFVSGAGGGLIGLVASIYYYNFYPEFKSEFAFFYFLTLGVSSGLIGSLLDSLLGAVLQETIYLRKSEQIISREEMIKFEPYEFKILGRNVLTNNLVNFLSATFTSVVLALKFFN